MNIIAKNKICNNAKDLIDPESKYFESQNLFT